jgi:ABC-type sugar transport system permease subunit
MIFPIILTAYYGFTDWNGINKEWNMVGFANFIKTFGDEKFFYSLRFTLFYTIVVTITSNVIGIIFAVFLQNSGRMTNVYRSVYFIPLLISPIAAGFVWKVLFSYTGIVNSQLSIIFGLDPVMFIGDPALSKLILILFNLWQSTGFCMVIYLAGLQTIPSELYDSTAIDGASGWERFWYVTLPFLAPATTSCVTFMFTGAMREYPRVLVLTAGGPVGATETIAFRIVKVGFQNNKLGYASAMALLTLLLTASISIILSRRLRKREECLR